MREHETSAPSLRELSEALAEGIYKLDPFPSRDEPFEPMEWEDLPSWAQDRNRGRAAKLLAGLLAGRLIDPTAMAEAVASARAEGWQPIETAPRDGQMIGVPGGCAFWAPGQKCWVTGVGQSYGRPIQWDLTVWKSLAPPTLIPGGSSDV